MSSFEPKSTPHVKLLEWIVLAVSLLLVASFSMIRAQSGDQRIGSSSTDASPRQLSPGLPPAPNGFVANWSPNVAPFGVPQDSLAQAESEIAYKLYLPDTATASDSSLTHVWIGSEPPGGEDMLPTTPQATVALAYSAGLQVTVVPWVYGVKAPPISQEDAAKSYEIAVSQDEGYSTGTIDGIPVLVYPHDKSGPGSVEFNLGTANSDALTIAVIGNMDTADLETVAESIIAQWGADHPSVG